MVVFHIVGEPRGEIVEVESPDLDRPVVILEPHHGVEIIYQVGEPVGVVQSAFYEYLFLWLRDAVVREYRVEITLYDSYRSVEFVADIDAYLPFVQILFLFCFYFLAIQQQESFGYFSKLVLGEPPCLYVVRQTVGGDAFSKVTQGVDVAAYRFRAEVCEYE